MTHAPTQSQAREMLARAREIAVEVVKSRRGWSSRAVEDILAGRFDGHDAVKAALIALTPASDDATVERAAKAIYETGCTFACIDDDVCTPWERLPEYAQDGYRDQARAAFDVAALPPRPSDDVAKLREALSKVRRTISRACDGGKAGRNNEVRIRATDWHRVMDLMSVVDAALADGEKSDG